MNITKNLSDMNQMVQSNLNESLQSSNESVAAYNANRQTINLNGSYIFDDDESMETLLNRIGLAVQRQGGQ
jgi:hypothetical protein